MNEKKNEMKFKINITYFSSELALFSRRKKKSLISNVNYTTLTTLLRYVLLTYILKSNEGSLLRENL